MNEKEIRKNKKIIQSKFIDKTLIDNDGGAELDRIKINIRNLMENQYKNQDHTHSHYGSFLNGVLGDLLYVYEIRIPSYRGGIRDIEFYISWISKGILNKVYTFEDVTERLNLDIRIVEEIEQDE